MTETIRVRMLETVCGTLGSPSGTVARKKKEYSAKSNKHGAISALCDNGEWLGMKPGEFEFLEAPEWLLRIWAKYDDNIMCRLKPRTTQGLKVKKSLTQQSTQEPGSIPLQPPQHTLCRNLVLRQ